MANLGSIDRIVRGLIGIALISYALPRGIDDVAWHWVGVLGAFVLLTAALRFCPLYHSLGLSTATGAAKSKGKPAI